MTKEEARRSLFNTEVYVDGKSKEIQEKLFELEFTWNLDKKVNYTDKPFLYINENGTLSYGDDMEFFKNDKAHEVSADYILNLEWDKDTKSKDGKVKVISMIVDDIDNLINGNNRIISVLYHNHADDNPKTASDLNTFDRCLVCSGKGCMWVPEIYGYKSDDGKHHLIGHSVSSEHVIPYDESLRGKLYNKEDESHE